MLTNRPLILKNTTLTEIGNYPKVPAQHYLAPIDNVLKLVSTVNGEQVVTTLGPSSLGDTVVYEDTAQTVTEKTFENCFIANDCEIDRPLTFLKDTTTTLMNATDDTKQVKFDLDGLTTEEIRLLAVPDASGTMVLHNNTQTLTNKTISGASNTLTNINLTTAVTGVLPVANGGTNASSLSGNRIAVTNAGGTALGTAAALTDGQLLMGSTGAAPVAAAITAGSGVTVTNGAGSISLAVDTAVVATLSGVQNLTNKTLDGTNFLNKAVTVLEDTNTVIVNASDDSKNMAFDVSGISTATTRTIAPPDASGTMVLHNNTQTLTNKTIAAGSNTITDLADANIASGAAIDATKIADGSVTSTEFQRLSTVGSAVAGISDSVTFTNKTMSGASNTFSNLPISGLTGVATTGTCSLSFFPDASFATVNVYYLSFGSAGIYFTCNPVWVSKSGSGPLILTLNGFTAVTRKHAITLGYQTGVNVNQSTPIAVWINNGDSNLQFGQYALGALISIDETDVDTSGEMIISGWLF